MTFFTDKRVRRGAPDGGCGGTGGDIVLEAHRSLHDLSHLRRRTIYGNDGASGSGRGKDGKNGGKTVIRVPCGTLLYEISCEEEI
jgi:GTP-binding protein